MERIFVIADSNSGITQEEGKELGIHVVAMPFTINGEGYFEGIDLTQEKFYEFLAADADVSTSQPSVFMIEELFEEKLKEYDSIFYFPMMSSLSGTCEAISKMAEKFEGRVHVMDNARISVTQKESVYETLAMIKKGYSSKEIEEYLYKTARVSAIYICPDTLKYLKKGGRIKPAAAALATLFRIKPLLYTKGEKFDCCNKCRTKLQAMNQMVKNIRADIESDDFKEYYKAGKLTLSVAYTVNIEDAYKMRDLLKAEFPDIPFRFVDPLSLSIACHIGANAIACGVIVNSFID